MRQSNINNNINFHDGIDTKQRTKMEGETYLKFITCCCCAVYVKMLPNAGCICLKLVFCTLRSFNYSTKTFIDKRERGKKELLYDTPNSYSTIITIIIPQTNHQQTNRSLVTYLDAVGIYVENQRQTFRISVFRDFM